MTVALFAVGQRVSVHPRTWILRKFNGCEGAVDTVELDEDETADENETPTLLYRVKLDDEPGQGYPYYAVELRRVEYEEISSEVSWVGERENG